MVFPPTGRWRAYWSVVLGLHTVTNHLGVDSSVRTVSGFPLLICLMVLQVLRNCAYSYFLFLQLLLVWNGIEPHLGPPQTSKSFKRDTIPSLNTFVSTHLKATYSTVRDEVAVGVSKTFRSGNPSCKRDCEDTQKEH